jgi:hypothetical protein
MNKRVKRRNSGDEVIPENCVAALRNMFALAVKDDIRCDNPAGSVTAASSGRY